MAGRRATPLPMELARAPLRTIRPKDVTGTYAAPRPELARLTDAGVLHRVARGYYIVVPQWQVGRPWLPELEAAAAGIATAAFGADRAVVMGVSAARLHGAIPRALATAVVATPRQHRAIALVDRPAVVTFVTRATDALDAERVETSLGAVLATTPEQTVLDLARRPALGDAESDVPTAVAMLYRRCDSERLADLAKRQRLLTALGTVKIWAGDEHES